jgi:hypothetical protein
LAERKDSVKDTLKDLGAELDYQMANNDWTKDPIWKKPLRRDTRIAVAIGAIIAVSMVVAAAVLFTHTFPSGVAGPHVTTSCSNLIMGLPSSPTGPGTVRFNCGTTTAALVFDGAGPVTPTFTLPASYSSLTIVATGAIATLCTGGTALASGTPVTPTAGSYDYCATYVAAGTLAGFPLAWNQP